MYVCMYARLHVRATQKLPFALDIISHKCVEIK